MSGKIEVTLRRTAATVLLALALLGAKAKASPGAAGTVEAPTYIPAGVSDAGGTVGCVRTPDGGLEAVDLATGRSLWRSAAPARALLVAPGRAFVLEERAGQPLRVAAYTPREGRLIRAYDLTTLELPPWASLGGAVEEREWTVFDVAARLAGDRLEVRYDITRRRVSGFVAPGVVGRVEGAAQISLDSGRVDRHARQWPSPPPLSEPMSPMPGVVRLLAVHARAADATLVMGGPPPNVEGALVSGDWRFAFELSEDTKTVTVHRWSAPAGGGRTTLRLEHGRATDAVWATLDRRHVLLRRAYEQQWYDLCSLETGKPMGSLERPVDVAVIGPRVYWTTLEAEGALALVATEAASGRTVWRRTVLEPDRRKTEPIP
jgi:hypothetical protein